MKTTRSSKATEMNMKRVCEEKYGVNAIQCDNVVLEWAADTMLAAGIAVETVKAQWKAIRTRRNMLGVYTTIPAYGHPCF